MKNPMGYAPVVAAAVIGGCVGGFADDIAWSNPTENTPVFEELSVKRLNVVEDDGRFALVVANSERLPGVIRDGEEAAKGARDGVGGALFYNQRGDEVGGLIFHSKEDDAGRRDGGVALSMDQIEQGQSLQMLTWMNGDFVRTALRMFDLPVDMTDDAWDDPDVAALDEQIRAAETNEERARLREERMHLLGEKRIWRDRIYLGSAGREDRTAMLELKDSRSRPRIRLSVDENDLPRIDILNENGEVVRSLTDEPE